MNKVSAALSTLLLIFFVINSNAQNNKLTVEKEPGWVTINSINYNTHNQDDDAEDGYLDLAYEKQVSLIEKAKYYKKISKILSESGVENNSSISIDFDPSYERLLLHKIRIIRDGVSIDKLKLSKFKTIQQENDLSSHLYNGTLTALLLLEDVRKGDIIEYSYTLRGLNPIFNNKYCDVFDTRFLVPVSNLYYRVVTTKDRKINIKSTDSAIFETTTVTQHGVEHEWKITEVKPLRVDKRIPSWFDPFPVIFISEYNSWNEVSAWASSLFPVKVDLSPILKTKIDAIRRNNSSKEAQTLEALRFVQDEVRYMGIEMGVGSHKPGDPNKIFSQRFGDCKDKSYLLVTMLRELGIEAYPILINTFYKRNINNWLPSHSAFNHVTVKGKINGTTYFFDPTISLQRGSLKDIVYPDYQTGLLISDTTQALTSIPSHYNGMTTIKETFNIADLTGKAQLKVVTKYTGSYADNIRNDFNNNSRYEIKKKYRDFYANYYEQIVADSISYKNDDNTGEFLTTEYYTIEGLWKTEKGEKNASFTFGPFIISSILSKPDGQKRTMPYSLTYPANYTEDIEINLPDKWSIDTKQNMVQCGFFNLNFESSYLNKSIKLHYEYENLKDYIPGAEMEIYLSQYKAAEDLCRSWNITLNNSASSDSLPLSAKSTGSTGNIFHQLYIILALFVFFTVMIKRKNRQQQF